MKKLLALVVSSIALAACSDATAPELRPNAAAAKASLDAATAVSAKGNGRIATN